MSQEGGGRSYVQVVLILYGSLDVRSSYELVK